MIQAARKIYSYRLLAHLGITLTTIGIFVLGILVFVIPEENQSSLTAPLVLVTVLFSCLSCLSSARPKPSGDIDWFHPSALFLVFFLTYFMFPGVWLWLTHDYRPIWIRPANQPAYLVNVAFILGALSTAMFALGSSVRLLPSKKVTLKLFNRQSVIRHSEAHIVVFLLLIVGFITTMYNILLYGPLNFDILNNLSPSALRALSLNISNVIPVLESGLNWAVLIAIYLYLSQYRMNGKKRLGSLLVIGTLLVVVFVLDYVVSAKRSVVIPLILFPVIWYHYLIRRITFPKMLVIGSLIGITIAALLIARIVLPMITKGLAPSDYIGKSLSGVIVFYFNSMEWSTFEMFLASITQRSELLTEAGGAISGFIHYSFNTFIIFVPRIIWPGKPSYDDISYVYFHVIWGSNDNVGAAPTIWSTSYLFFGIMGLTVGMFILGWLLKVIYSFIQPYQGRLFGVFSYAIFFWIVFQFLRFGTIGFTFINFVQTMILGVLVGLFLMRRARVS